MHRKKDFSRGGRGKPSKAESDRGLGSGTLAPHLICKNHQKDSNLPHFFAQKCEDILAQFRG